MQKVIMGLRYMYKVVEKKNCNDEQTNERETLIFWLFPAVEETDS